MQADLDANGWCTLVEPVIQRIASREKIDYHLHNGHCHLITHFSIDCPWISASHLSIVHVKIDYRWLSGEKIKNLDNNNCTIACTFLINYCFLCVINVMDNFYIPCITWILFSFLRVVVSSSRKLLQRRKWSIVDALASWCILHGACFSARLLPWYRGCSAAAPTCRNRHCETENNAKLRDETNRETFGCLRVFT